MAMVVDRPISRRPITKWLVVLTVGFVVGAAAVMLADPGTTETRLVVSSASSGGIHDLNGHHILGVKATDVAAEHAPDKPLDPLTRGLLRNQLTIARATAMRYPTVADAMAAGYRLVGGFGPGAGAHYIGRYMTGPGAFDASKPQSLIYDGTSPNSQIVGLMYYGMGAKAPQGFAGPNDHWMGTEYGREIRLPSASSSRSLSQGDVFLPAVRLSPGLPSSQPMALLLLLFFSIYPLIFPVSSLDCNLLFRHISRS